MRNKTSSASFPFLSILVLIFITLKLCGVIAWSWVWVLAPFWIPVALFLTVLLVIVCLKMAVK